MSSSMEHVYEAIKSILIEHLPEELAAVTAEYAAIDAANYGEGLDAVTPADDAYFLEDYNIPNGSYPSVLMVFPKCVRQLGGLAQELSGEVQVHVCDLGDGRVPRLIRRYVKAIYNVIQAHKTLDGACKLILPGSEMYASYEGAQDGSYFRAGGLEIAVKIT